MGRLKQFAAALGALGIAALAIWIGTILAVILIVVLLIAAVFGRFWFAKNIKRAQADMERAQAEAQRAHPDRVVIDAEYSVDADRDQARETEQRP